MSAIILIIAVAVYVGFYFLYGKRIEKKIVRADPAAETPAHRLRDEQDYIPANRFVLFGHHFASIAGAAPIIGPVLAMVWGWLPGLLWVWFGNIFIGAVHDYLALMASVRYDGKSIQWIAGDLITKRTRYAFSVFIFIVLILVVAAFAAVEGKLFVDMPSVPTANLLLILSAIILGILLYRKGLNFKLATLIGILMLIASIAAAFYLPLRLPYHAWLVILLVYIIIAASIPVNVLLQPRDYLNAWLLVFGLVLGSVSLIVGRFSFDFPAFTAYSAPVFKAGTQMISGPFWPVIPLIIACGSLSGFHALVGSGTTSKQLDKETDALFIGCGGMFTEGFLSTIVIACVASFAITLAGEGSALLSLWQAGELDAGLFSNTYLGVMKDSGGPLGMFSKCFGLAAHRALGLSENFVTVLAALWCSAFAMTTLDTTNRIARYTWTELLDPLKKSSSGLHAALTNRWIAAVVPAGLGILLAWSGKYAIIWPAFGGANQMLASIALITVSVWVFKILKARGGLLVLLPALVLWFTVTSALAWYLVEVVPVFSRDNALQGVALGVIVGLMLVLNLLLFVDFVIRMRKE